MSSPEAKKKSLASGTPAEQREMHDVQEMHAPIMREKADPRDGFEPVPLWLTLIFGGIVFWAGYYLASYSGNFNSNIYDENRSNPSSVANEDESIDPIVLGKRLYTANCVACHQNSGLGVAGQFPPLAGSQWVTGDQGKLIRVLLHGLQGPVTVKGSLYNGNMPAFGQKLNDEKLAAVLTYIRQEWGNEAFSLSSEDIKSVREKTSQRSMPWTEAELTNLSAEISPLETKGANENKK